MRCVSSVVAGVLLLGVPAWAQEGDKGSPGCCAAGQGQGQGQGQGMTKGQMNCPMQGSSMYEASPQAGTNHGTVEGIVQRSNIAHGTLQVLTGDGPVMLRAKPDQISVFRPGDVVRMSYGSFGGQKWVRSYLGGHGAGARPSVAMQGANVTTGTISSLNKANGQITIRTDEGSRSFQVYPGELRGLSAGEPVSLTYNRVGDSDWVSSIRRQPRQQGGAEPEGGEVGE